MNKDLINENKKLRQANNRLRAELWEKEQKVQELVDIINNYLESIKARTTNNEKAKITETWVSKEENIRPTEIRIRSIVIPSFRVNWEE